MELDVLSYLVETMNSFANGVGSVILAIIAIVALIPCFFGFKIMKMFFAFWGFLLGAAIGGAVSALAFGGDMIGAIVVGAVLIGILGAFLLYKMYLVGVFLTDTTLSFLLFAALLGFEDVGFIIAGVLAIIVGILAVKFVRVWTIILTGAFGGEIAGSAISAMFGLTLPGFHILFGMIIAVLGILYQFKSTKKDKKTKPAPAVATETPAETVEVKEEIVTEPAVSKEPKAIDPKKKKLIFAIGGGALALVLVIIAIASKGPAKPKAGFEKMDYVAADGKDISRSAIWFGAHSLEDVAPTQSIEYFSGKENKVIIAYGPATTEEEGYGTAYYLSDINGKVLLGAIEEITYIGDANNEPMFFIYKGDFSGIINAKGETVADFGEMGIYSNSNIRYSDDLCIVSERDGDNLGALDSSGNLVIPFILDYSFEGSPMFKNGYLRVAKDIDGKRLWGIIDKNGNEIFPCEYDYLSNVVDGQVIAGKDGTFNGLNLDGTDALGMSFNNYPKVSGFLGWSNTESAVFDPNGYYKKETRPFVEHYINGSKATETDHGFYIFGEYLYGLADPDENVLLEEENLYIDPCDFEEGLFQVWYESENGTATYYVDFKGTRRTPDFPAYTDEYKATPVFKGTTGYGILPKLLTKDDIKEFESIKR